MARRDKSHGFQTVTVICDSTDETLVYSPRGDDKCPHYDQQLRPVKSEDLQLGTPSPGVTTGLDENIPDGGWGWVVCLASFWTNGTLFGIMNCFGVLYVKLEKKFSETHTDAAFLTSWVGSVSIGMTFLLSPVASIMTDRYGIPSTAFVGGMMATLGMLLSSFVNQLEYLYLTYGVIMGVGASLAYTPSLVILGHYFQKRLGLVNGLVTAGSSVFTMVMPLILKHLLESVGLKTTLQILSGMMGLVMLCALTFKPRISPQNKYAVFESSKKQTSWCHEFFQGFLSVEIWRNRRYVLWVFAIPMALFGYFVPYVHLVKHVRVILPDSNGEILMTCIGLTSGIGRIVFGKIADFKRVNRIHLQQISFLSIGVLTMLLVVAKQFPVLIIMCLFLGLFDGCFISLLGPIAFDIVGHKGASQAIGFLLGFCSIPLMVGPPIAGLMYDNLGNYTAAFLAAGAPPIVGAALMCLIHRISDDHCPHHHCHEHHHPHPPEVEVPLPIKTIKKTTEEKQKLVTINQPPKAEDVIWEKQTTPSTLQNGAAFFRNIKSYAPKPIYPMRTETNNSKQRVSGFFAPGPIPIEAALCLLERESSV